MKITKSRLKEIIMEELNEQPSGCEELMKRKAELRKKLISLGHDINRKDERGERVSQDEMMTVWGLENEIRDLRNSEQHKRCLEKETSKNEVRMKKSQLEQIVREELENMFSENEKYYHISDATYDDGSIAEDVEFWDDVIEEAEYQGRKVPLNKPMRGDVKKSKVYVKDPKTGNVKKVNFGDPNMKIRKSNPKARKSFRARHNCDNPGPKTKARYWSCKAW